MDLPPMDLPPSIPMSQNVFDTHETNGYHLPVMTGSYLPMTFHHKYLKGNPLTLGSVIIVVSLIQIVIGIQSFLYRPIGPFSVFTGIMYWAPVFYIITGSLMIAGKYKPSICLVNSSMILNILNSFMSFIGLILAAIDIHIVTGQCHQYFRTDLRCVGFGGMATYSILLVSDVLLLFIFIYCAVFGGLSMKHVPSIPQIFLVQNGVLVPAPTAAFPTMPVVFKQSPPSCTVLVENNQH